jgi:ATP-binding cassette subfamily B protein
MLCYLLASLAGNVVYANVSLLVGAAFTAVLGGSLAALSHIVLLMLLTILLGGCADVGARIFPELIGKRIARDARSELYLSLLGKSQTFHNRQRVGDIMARAANDMTQLSNMITPGGDILCDSNVSLATTLLFIASINRQLLLVPLLFTASFLLAVRFYSRQLAPVADRMREQFGELNASLNEAMGGIEVVKAAAQEKAEIQKFEQCAGLYRNLL